jgi:hypothetical protein
MFGRLIAACAVHEGPSAHIHVRYALICARACTRTQHEWPKTARGSPISTEVASKKQERPEDFSYFSSLGPPDRLTGRPDPAEQGERGKQQPRTLPHPVVLSSSHSCRARPAIHFRLPICITASSCSDNYTSIFLLRRAPAHFRCHANPLSPARFSHLVLKPSTNFRATSTLLLTSRVYLQLYTKVTTTPSNSFAFYSLSLFL